MRTPKRLTWLLITYPLRLFVVACLIFFQSSLIWGETPSGIQEKHSSVGPSNKAAPPYRSERLRGRVVWLADALKREFGITTVAEVSENVLAIQTEEGKLFPIVENIRGRAFRKDDRLREMDLELSVRVFEKQPFVQIVGIFEVDGGERHEVDYWCDVCAIVMYEAGPCSCCQDDNRMRKRRVVDGETLSEEIGHKK